MKTFYIFILFLFSGSAWASNWPEAPWLNSTPKENSLVSVVAFLSPYDLQFYRMMSLWKKLEKRYENLPVQFLIVLKSEPNLSLYDENIRDLIRDANFPLPVLLDFKGNYSRSVHAYALPTVILFSKDSQTLSLDPFTFDPATLEKAVQRYLRENGQTALPPREFASEVEFKNCGHGRTTFLGEKFQKLWNLESMSIQNGWTTHPLYIEKNLGPPATLEVSALKTSVGLLAENLGHSPIRITVNLDGAKIPIDQRGRDVFEDKLGTFITVRALKMYDVLNHSAHTKDGPEKLTFVAEGKDLRVRAVETLPPCPAPRE